MSKSTRLLSVLLTASLSLTAFFPVLAESCNEKDQCLGQPYLEEVVITGTRTTKSLLYSPNAISVIDWEDMRRYAGESLAEVLRDIPGVNITDSGQAGMQRIRIRGEESYRVAILIDGQEVTDHRGEGVPLTLDPSVVERVEVVRGAGSVLYGPKALGGVINYITRKGGDQPLQLTVATSYDSATEGERYFSSVYGGLETIDYRLSVAKSQQGFRDTPVGEIENTKSESDSVSLYLGKRWGQHKLAVTADDHDAFSDVFVADEVRFHFPFTEFALNIPQRDRRKIGVFYDWNDETSKLTKIHVDAYRQVSDRQFGTYWEQGAFGLEKEIFSESELLTSGVLAQIDWQLNDDHYLITGIQYVKDEATQTREEFLHFTNPFPMTIPTSVFDKAELETKAIFIQDEWQVNDNVIVTAGARQYWVESKLLETNRAGLDTPDKDDNELIVSLAVNWELNENSVIRAAYNEGYIYPSLLQLAMGGVERVFVNPDTSLEPEESKTWELGWRYKSQKAQFDATLFASDADNYIDHVPCFELRCIGGTRRSPAELYVNIGEAETRGLEVYGEYSINHTLQAYTSLTFLRRKNIFESFSTTDSGIPRVSGVLGLKYRGNLSVGSYWLDAYLRGESEAEEIESDSDMHENSGWVTYNLETGLSFGKDDRYRLILNLLNLSNKRYSTATENLLAPERSVQARLVIDF